MKKRLFILLIAILGLILVGCAESQLTLNNKEDKAELERNNVASLSTDKNVMLFSTLSSASLLKDMESGVASLSENKPIFGEEETIEIDMEKANSYLLMMENILADGGPVVVSETESDREGYDTMMVITVKDLVGNTNTYTIYYSIVVEEEVLPEVPGVPEEPGVEETPVEPDAIEDALPSPQLRHGSKDDYDEETETHNHGWGNQDKHDKAEDQFKNHHHWYDKDEEVEYELNALAVIEGVEYEISGKKEVEYDDDEEEIEIKFIVKLDEENYVVIKQEIEDDEIEYEYSVYQNKRKVSTLKFESEEENGKTVVKLTTNENGYKETYKFTKGENYTVIKYQGNKYSYTLVVTTRLDEATGDIVYEYKVKEKEYSWEYHKHHNHK